MICEQCKIEIPISNIKINKNGKTYFYKRQITVKCNGLNVCRRCYQRYKKYGNFKCYQKKLLSPEELEKRKEISQKKRKEQRQRKSALIKARNSYLKTLSVEELLKVVGFKAGE